MLDEQDLLSWIAAIGGVGGIVAAIFAFLAYRSRYGVPKFLPILKEIQAKGRFLEIRQLEEKNLWLVCSVRLARKREEWLAETGPSYQEAKWRRNIVFSSPSGSPVLFLHPAASSKQVLCLTVRLQGDPFVKRRIKRPLYSHYP